MSKQSEQFKKELSCEVSEGTRSTVIYAPVKYLSRDFTFGDLSTSYSAVIKKEERNSGMSAALQMKKIKCPPKHLKATEASAAKNTLISEQKTAYLSQTSLPMQIDLKEITSVSAEKKEGTRDHMSCEVKPEGSASSSNVPKLEAESSGGVLEKKVKKKPFKNVLSRKGEQIDRAPKLKEENSMHVPEIKTERAGDVQKSEREFDSTGDAFSRKREHSPEKSERKVDSTGYKSPPKKSRLDKGRLMKSEIIWILEKRRKWWHKPVNLRGMSKERLLDLLEPEPTAGELQELKDRFQKASNLFPDMKLEDLQEELKKRGVSYSGLARGELVERLDEAMKAKTVVNPFLARTGIQRPESKTGNLAKTGSQRPESKAVKCRDKPTVSVMPKAVPNEHDMTEEADASAHNRWNCVVL